MNENNDICQVAFALGWQMAIQAVAKYERAKADWGSALLAFPVELPDTERLALLIQQAKETKK